MFVKGGQIQKKNFRAVCLGSFFIFNSLLPFFTGFLFPRLDSRGSSIRDR